MEISISNNKVEVAEVFAEYLKDLIVSNNQVNIALSGGSTPKVVFDYMAEHYNELEWSKVHFYWGDERCVPPTHTESNYKMTVDHLISKISIPTQNINRIKGENDPIEEAKAYGTAIENNVPLVEGIPQFDLVMLGMGDDGHTVSIFPHQIELWDSTNTCEVATHPDSGQKRVTITGKIVNQAKEIAFLVTGKGKAEKLAAILKNENESKQYPASLVNPANGHLTWFVDEEAASLTEPSS